MDNTPNEYQFESAAAGYETRPAQLQELSMQEHLVMLDKLLLAQKDEIEKMNLEDMKNHQLPLARVKKIMKSDEDVRMISAEAPALFAKACEMFIIELTHRSWLYTEENRRRTLQRSDIATAIAQTDIFDFLIDIVPREK
jgi:nuclear transcription factor Y gamma